MIILIKLVAINEEVEIKVNKKIKIGMIRQLLQERYPYLSNVQHLYHPELGMLNDKLSLDDYFGYDYEILWMI